MRGGTATRSERHLGRPYHRRRSADPPNANARPGPSRRDGGAAAALLLLTDGRLPAGGYAHSGGLEPSVTAGRVVDACGLEAFLSGRAVTAGAVAAAFAAAACGACGDDDTELLGVLDGELDARMPSAAQRSTSRQLGRQLRRAVEVISPHVALGRLGSRPHVALAVGATCSGLGLTRHDAALATLHDSVVGPATAAVRLLSLDPLATFAALARLGPLLDTLAAKAVQDSMGAVEDLPAFAAPLLDICAEHHSAARMRLFAS